MPITLFSTKEWSEQTKNQGKDNQLVVDALSRVYQATLIYPLFDALVELIKASDQYITKNSNAALLASAQELKNQALSFAMAIVDARDEKDWLIKVEKRNKYKTADPQYMPWPVPLSRTPLETKRISSPNHSAIEEKHSASQSKPSSIFFSKTNVAEECKKFILSHFKYEEYAAIIKEWNDNASIRQIEEKFKIVQPYSLVKLEKNELQQGFINAIKALSKQSDKNKTPTTLTPERRAYLKSAIQQVGKNTREERFCVNSMDEFTTTRYVYDEIEREQYRVFAAQGKLKKIIPSANQGNINITINFDPAIQVGEHYEVGGYVLARLSRGWQLFEITGINPAPADIYGIRFAQLQTKEININLLKNLRPLLTHFSPSKNSYRQTANQIIKEIETFHIDKMGTKKFILENVNTHGEQMLVVTPKGEMYAGESMLHRFHHSSFVAGSALAFASDFKANDGKISEFNDNSGHYRPNFRKHTQILAFFRRLGLIDSSTGHEHVVDYSHWREKHPLRDFEISSTTQEKLLQRIDEFINSYVAIKDDKLVPHFKHRLMGHSKVINEEVKLAMSLKFCLENTTDYFTFLTLMKEFEYKSYGFDLRFNNARELELVNAENKKILSQNLPLKVQRNIKTIHMALEKQDIQLLRKFLPELLSLLPDKNKILLSGQVFRNLAHELANIVKQDTSPRNVR